MSGEKQDRKQAYYPVFLNISGRKCVVVGGGQVALRKVRGLLECGADVEVISPDLCPGLARFAEDGEIIVLRRAYPQGALKGAFLAVAATDDDDINRWVAAEARSAGVLVNVVDGARDSDFIAASCARRGKITIAVSTAGASPALARKVRSRIEEVFGEEYAPLADLVEDVRAELKRREIRVDGEGWQQALDLDLIVDLLKQGEREKARSVLLANLQAQYRQD